MFWNHCCEWIRSGAAKTKKNETLFHQSDAAAGSRGMISSSPDTIVSVCLSRCLRFFRLISLGGYPGLSSHVKKICARSLVPCDEINLLLVLKMCQTQAMPGGIASPRYIAA